MVITKKKVKKIALLSANVLLILGLGFTSGFYYLRYSNEKNKNLTTEQRIDKYEKEISKTFTLPKGERPKIADVNLADETKKIDKEFNEIWMGFIEMYPPTIITNPNLI